MTKKEDLPEEEGTESLFGEGTEKEEADAALPQSGEAPAAADSQEAGEGEAAEEAGDAEEAAEAPADALELVGQFMGETEADERDAGELTLARFASRAYLDYAISVVTDRALPNVCDGQKPVQRRILYDMERELHLTADKNFVKSARVVGDVLGKFHPHGDQSAYDAMVRMAQSFSLRYPLVDGHGNFGSRDGDGPAAMRYTEAKLTKISELLLSEITLGTVDFIPNYDGNFKEPSVLPARLPFVLLNGASGIAVGMATEIPSHNLKEVASACRLLLANPEATLDDVLAVLPAPDYPGGAQIISAPSVIREAYRTGRGTLRVRARYEFEEMARGQWRLIVTELPPGTSSAQVLSELEAITNPRPKSGKKSLTSDQQQAKSAMLAVLSHVRDESDKNVPVRLVFEPKTSKIDRGAFVSALFTQTSLECNAPMNLVMIGTDGRPRQKPLLEILHEWVAFRVATVRRRCETRLGSVLDRIHVLEGRVKVLLNIDEVIRIIRGSDEPKAELMRAFALTDRQAEDILEIRLRQLSRMSEIQIQQELADCRKEAESLEALLASEAKLAKAVSKEIGQDAKAYGDERRTLVEPAETLQAQAQVADEPVTVVISEKGYVRTRGGHGHDVSVMSYKIGDGPGSSIECRTTDTLAILTTAGRAYSLAVSQLPGSRGDGLPISSLIDLEPGAEIAGILSGPAARRVFLAGTEGYGFISKLGDLQTRLKAGKAFVRVDGGRLLPPVLIEDDQELVAVLSERGRLLVFPLAEMRTLPSGGLGVSLMGLEDGESIVAALPIASAGVVVTGEGRAKKPREETLSGAKLAEFTLHRTRKGRGVSPRLIRVTGLRALPANGAPSPAETLPPEDEEGNLKLL